MRPASVRTPRPGGRRVASARRLRAPVAATPAIFTPTAERMYDCRAVVTSGGYAALRAAGAADTRPMSAPPARAPAASAPPASPTSGGTARVGTSLFGAPSYRDLVERATAGGATGASVGRITPRARRQVAGDALPPARGATGAADVSDIIGGLRDVAELTRTQLEATLAATNRQITEVAGGWLGSSPAPAYRHGAKHGMMPRQAGDDGAVVEPAPPVTDAGGAFSRLTKPDGPTKMRLKRADILLKQVRTLRCPPHATQPCSSPFTSTLPSLPNCLNPLNPPPTT